MYKTFPPPTHTQTKKKNLPDLIGSWSIYKVDNIYLDAVDFHFSYQAKLENCNIKYKSDQGSWGGGLIYP